MNQPSEDYPIFFPTVIPPPPPGLFTIPPPPNFLTILPPAKKPKSNTGLIAAVSVLAVVVVFMALIVYKWYKKQHQDDSKVEQDVRKNNVCKVEVVHNKSKKVRSTKNAKKSNVHERDMPIYGYDRRLAQCNGRLIEARYGKEPKKNYNYEGDLESGFDEIYSSSEDESKFYERSNKKILVTYARDDDTKSNVYKGEGDTYLQGETTHDRQTEVESDKDAMSSNVPEGSNKLVINANDDMKIMAYEGEGDASSEGETTHNRQSKEGGSDKDATGSTVPERDLESALFESGTGRTVPERDLESALFESGTGRTVPKRDLESELFESSTGRTVPEKDLESALFESGTGSTVPETDLESALFESGPLKSKDAINRTGKSKKGKGRAG